MFEIKPTGDPYNEYKESFDEPTCVFRGDLSPVRGKRETINLLRRLYPGCKIRVSD